MRVRVIIPYYLGERTIATCLNSIDSSHYRVEEVVIVDNSPTPVTEALSGVSAGIPTVLTTRCGIGFARACNVGMAYALSRETEIIILLNQDAYVFPHCIGQLVQQLRAKSSAFAAAPIELTYDGNDISKFVLRNYLLKNEELVRDLLLERTKGSYEVPYNGVNGSCLALTAKGVAQVGMFDPLFFMYGEERDLLYRAEQQSLKIIQVPGAKIGHVHSHASTTDRRQKMKIQTWGQRERSIRRLKLPSHSIPRALWQSAVSALLWYAKPLRRFEFRRLLAYLRGDLSALRDVAKILRHRSASQIRHSVARQISADTSAP